MQTKNIIAVELHRANGKISFEIFELDLHEVCKLSGGVSKFDIDSINKKSLGFITVQSSQWFFEDGDIYKKPKFENHPLTRIEAHLSVYSADPADIGELKNMRPKPYFVVDAQTQDYQSITPAVVYRAIKSTNSHYKINFTHLFLVNQKNCLFFDVCSPFLLTSEIYTAEHAANSAYLETNLI